MEEESFTPIILCFNLMGLGSVLINAVHVNQTHFYKKIKNKIITLFSLF